MLKPPRRRGRPTACHCYFFATLAMIMLHCIHIPSRSYLSWQTKSLGRRGLPSFGEFGLRMHCCILNGSPRFVTRELGGEYNQSCQQYRSDNSISLKPATKRFLIFRIEPLILIDHLSAHRPLLPTS